MATDELLVVGMYPDSRLPTRGYAGDAGLDLYCVEDATIEPGKWVDVDLGVRVALPTGYWGLLTGRSSTLRRRGLLVNQGIIDNGYRGPLFANMVNMTDQPVDVYKGERLVQLIVLPIWDHSPVPCTILPDSDRGNQGFGSTGS